MPGEYRDPLAAALSRIEALERENAALKRLRGDRPVTASEAEAVRIEQQVLQLDVAWKARVQSAHGGVTARTARAWDRFTELFPLALAIFGATMAVIAKHPGKVAFGFSLATVLTYVALRWSMIRFHRELAVHEAQRAKLLRELARLRGTPDPAPPADARVRVAEAGEEPAPEADEPAEGEEPRRRARS